MKNSENLCNPLDTIKRNTNIYIQPLSETYKHNQNRIKVIFKSIKTENFPNVEKEMDIQMYDTLKIPNILKPEKATLKHIIIKVSKSKRSF